jgi:L-threonylcarbamoyladenylate synthase
MDILKITNNNTDLHRIIQRVITTLCSDGLVVFPSDTVYGLLCEATNELAVKKLIEFKNRPPGKPISVFVSSFKSLKDQVEVNDKQEKILRELLPGPFTIILSSKHKVNYLLESEKGTLGIRLPKYQLITDLVQQSGSPLTATSANLSGTSPHYAIETLLKELPKKKQRLIDLIIDAGTLPRHKPSTILDLTESNIKTLRQGDAVMGNTQTFFSKTEDETKAIAQSMIKRIHSEKPIVIILEGELGAGKTVFVKGVGEYFGIKNIISPTFVIYYEYDNFYHFDLYGIEDREEFCHLGIEKLLIPGNILCFEWGEKAGEIIDILKEKAEVVYVNIKYRGEKEREIKIIK